MKHLLSQLDATDIRDLDTQQVGFIVNGDKGCSPDSLIGEFGRIAQDVTMNDLTIRGRAIRSDENGLICLTDIWEAAGFKVNQLPRDWWRLPSAQSLTAALIGQIVGKSHNKKKISVKSIYYAKTGKAGGTFAHPILACAYAGRGALHLSLPASGQAAEGLSVRLGGLQMKRLLSQLDATDIRDLVVIALFIGTLMIGAAIGAGA